MDDALVSAVIIAAAFMVAGVAGWAFGHMIRTRTLADLTDRIAEWDVHDRRGLARWLGRGVQVLSALGLGTSALILAFPALAIRISGAFALVLAAGVTALALGSRRFVD